MSIISHNSFNSYAEAKQEILNRINDTSLLDELDQYKLGQFLILNRGLNAYWTKIITSKDISIAETDFEKNLILNMPTFMATQERFIIFKETVANLRYSSNIISAPAGLLPEFTHDLIIDKNFKIDAYDLDSSCSVLSGFDKLDNVKYHESNIFELDISSKYDYCISNGLNIYIKDNEQIISLYKVLNKSLKDGAKLVTSFLNHPELFSFENINLDNLKLEKKIFTDILNIGWKKYHAEREFILILEKAGFAIDDIVYDSQKIFPTVIATKIMIFVMMIILYLTNLLII